MDTMSVPLTENLGWLLAQAGHALMTQQTARLESLGIFPRGVCVMSTALDAELTQTEIAQTVGIDKTTMVVTVDQLERDGLVERRPSSTDRRARVIAVTAKGRKKVEEAEAVIAELHGEVLAALPAGARKTLLASLAKLIDGPLAEPAACTKPVRRRQPRAVAA